jgi:hypothetical protein
VDFGGLTQEFKQDLLERENAKFVTERRAWQESNSRLEERIEKLQLELVDNLETEKEQDIQRQVDFANLKQEFKQALLERENAARQQRQPPPSSHLHADASPNRTPLMERAKLSFGTSSSSRNRNNDSEYHAQEHFVDKVNDFGKLVHTAAKETAERVVSEAEQWSAHAKHNQSMHHDHAGAANHTEKHTNFRTVATTLVSSVALASLATVVVYKATTYIAGWGEEQD